MGAITTVEGTEPWRSAAQTLLDENGYSVVRWRNNMTGVAFTGVSNPDDFEAPRPRTAKSFAVFAHEVGHLKLHATNGNYHRWREEIEAWDFAIECFDRFGLKGKRKIIDYAEGSIGYAIQKAINRGVQDFIPTLRREYPRWYRRYYKS